MNRLEILTYPNPILKKVSTDVTEIDQDLVDFVRDMEFTMYDAYGIGLAAAQVGRNINVLTLDVTQESDRSGLMHLINPVIADAHGKTHYEEGCLSFPGITAEIQRKKEIHVLAYDVHGKTLDFEASGLAAICIQHEMDHLRGITFVDRLTPVQRKLLLREYQAEKIAQIEGERERLIRKLHEGK